MPMQGRLFVALSTLMLGACGGGDPGITSVDDEMCFFWAYYFPSRGPLVCANGLFPCN